MRLDFRFLAAGVLLLLPVDAAAQLGCWVGMGDIQFGNVNQVGQGDSTSTGGMSLSCSGATTPYVRVCIALGAPVDSSWDPRYLLGQSSGARLAYNIYKDASYTQIWGSAYSTAGSPRAIDVAISYGSGNAQVPYYAKLPAQNDAPADSYVATFTYANDAAVRAVGYFGSPPACSSSMTIVSRFEFSVRATVQGDCAITASNLDFGSTGLELAASATDAVSSITIRCTKGLPYSISLDAGTGAGATVSERRMTRIAGQEILRYGIYKDSARSQSWGDGSAGTGTVSGIGGGTQSTNLHSVYGRVLVQSQPPSGQYRDTITATVTF